MKRNMYHDMWFAGRRLATPAWGLGLGMLLFLVPTHTQEEGCDFTANSRDVETNGTFHSPNWPSNYNKNSRCIYSFIGDPHQRVRIEFKYFEVKGVMPSCKHDYIDVYTQVSYPHQDLLDVPLHGRYCGADLDDLPAVLISMANIFVLVFYTDNNLEDKGFLGSYRFINASMFVVGTPAAPTVCGQTINGDTLSQGIILSPTYPGEYPDNIRCYYKIKGRPGTRIRFSFLDLDLYSGGEHCPFDYVKVYDNVTNEGEVVGIYCGKLRDYTVYGSMDIFSTSNSMHIEFVTRSGRVEPTKPGYFRFDQIGEDVEVQRRGFKAEFLISDDFVKLDFIREGYHERGTDCDQRIFSTGESNGTLTSPNFPARYPANVTCHYFIDGLVDTQNLEKVKFQFETFNIPNQTESCENGYVKAYTRGQNHLEEPTPDYVFCGRSTPPPVVTSHPRLLLVFNSTGKQPGKGFRAHYQFVTDYAIPGTPASDGAKCHFIYRSASSKEGRFNSPRHPSYYPSNTTCIYEFMGSTSEQVRITFETFQVEGNHSNCYEDYMEVFEVKPWRSGYGNQDLLVGVYCGRYNPGPIVSRVDVHALKIVFHSNDAVVKSGFRAKYEFIGIMPSSLRCFENITDGGGGAITSPNYPHKYLKNKTCEWQIWSRYRDGRILLQLGNEVNNMFAMEGTHKSEDNSYECANAVLRIYTNKSEIATYEICSGEPHLHTFISQENFMRVRFISSARSNGAKGFKIAWTEIVPAAIGKCKGFVCQQTKYCIASNLRCNQLPNCGMLNGEADKSDEPKCDSTYSDHGVLHIILGVVVSLIFLVFIIVCVLHRRRKAKKKKNKKEIEVRYVTRSSSTPNRASGPATDRLLKERTEKVSIV